MNVPDPLLTTLAEQLLSQIEVTLTNDEASTDAELKELFVRYGLTAEQSNRAVEYRSRYIGRAYLNPNTPIRVGDDNALPLSNLDPYI